MRPTLAPLAILGIWLPTACGSPETGAGGERMAETELPPISASVETALGSITEKGLLSHIEVLASDEFEGRAPGTAGEELTVEYLVGQFRQLGLAPGNPDGTYVQEVPLVGLTGTVAEASFLGGGEPVPMRGKEDFIALTTRPVPEVEVRDSELVFVGYGVVAPEYEWDDFKDVDVSGKTLLVLVNDPAIPDPADPAGLDPTMFRGREMTYYGRWTYKYEVAARKGAAAVFVIHETGPAGYPWAVPAAGWGREQFEIAGEVSEPPPVAINGWMHMDAATRLFDAAGLDLQQLKTAALDPGFRPIALDGSVTIKLRNRMREIRSRNVLAKLEGADPDRRDEYVIYTAHWDHLGRNESLAGDQIYNGAHDNASGTAGLLEIARAFASLDAPPDRSVLFLAVTAEEKGLLGARYYAQHPLYPLSRTLADINMDGANLWGRTEDIVVVGLGNSTLDDLLATAAAEMGRVVVPDAEPEKGFFYRSDHFEFAKEGVPALYVDEGTRFLGRAEGYGEEKRRQYTERDYHKPSDEIKPDWDLSGAAEDFRLLFLVGYAVAVDDLWPEWKPGTEFEAKRAAMLREGSG